MEEYLTTKELSDRIKMTPGTIRNMVCSGRFEQGKHFVKAGPRKLLFLWSRIEIWLNRGSPSDEMPNRQER